MFHCKSATREAWFFGQSSTYIVRKRDCWHAIIVHCHSFEMLLAMAFQDSSKGISAEWAVYFKLQLIALSEYLDLYKAFQCITIHLLIHFWYQNWNASFLLHSSLALNRIDSCLCCSLEYAWTSGNLYPLIIPLNS